MMTPQCPDHGTLLLDLARGRLDDDQSANAEALRSSCAACAAWWERSFEGSAAELVDLAVADAFAAVELPERRSWRSFWAVAAAVVVLIGASLLWHGSSVSTRPPAVARDISVATPQVISVLDFESGSVAAPQSPATLITSLDFEAGSINQAGPRT